MKREKKKLSYFIKEKIAKKLWEKIRLLISLERLHDSYRLFIGICAQ